MLKYYVTSIVYTIDGDDSPAELSEYNGQFKFAQYFERTWSTKLFDSELEALNFLRQLYPEKTLTVLEDTGKIVSTFGHESAITSMKIRKETNF